MQRTFLLLLALMCVSITFHGQTSALINPPSQCGRSPLPARLDEIDRGITAIMNANHVPGMSIAVIRNGSIEKVSAYGWSDLERCVPATTKTLFGIGSLSKQFTAAGILVLVQRNQLSLDGPIVKYLPEGIGRWDAITIRQLLTHTSGIKDYCGDDSNHETVKIDRGANIPTEEIVRIFASAPLNFRPGADWAYSNTGYVLLSIIAERISGQSFPEFMRDNVFHPLGLEATRYYSPRELIPNKSVPYHVESTGKTTLGDYIADQFTRWGDTGMISNAEDMAKWALALDNNALLPRSAWQQMTTPVSLPNELLFPYGMGLNLWLSGGDRIISHNGTFRVGYSANIVKLPTRGLAIVSMANHWGDESPHDAVAREIFKSLKTSRADRVHQLGPDPQPKLSEALFRLLEGKDEAHGGAAATPSVHHLLNTLGRFPNLKSIKLVDCQSYAGTAVLGTTAVRDCTYSIASDAGLPFLTFNLSADDIVAGVSIW